MYSVGVLVACAVFSFDFYFDKTHSQMLGKIEYTGGPIFKVVLEC